MTSLALGVLKGRMKTKFFAETGQEQSQEKLHIYVCIYYPRLAFERSRLNCARRNRAPSLRDERLVQRFSHNFPRQ